MIRFGAWKHMLSEENPFTEGGNVQVLEVTAREIDVRNNLDLSLTDLGDLYGLAKVSHTAIDLDLILEELLKRGDIEDLIGCWLGSVDDELPIYVNIELRRE
jgi:hypothetical protein